MANPLRLYDLGLSPNGKRARLALGLKGLEHELVNVDPHKRDPVIEASGQRCRAHALVVLVEQFL